MPLLPSRITLPQIADAKPEGNAIAYSVVAISRVQGLREASQCLEARLKTRVRP